MSLGDKQTRRGTGYDDWISVLTSVGCFGGSRAARPVLELLRKPGAVARKADYKRLRMYIGLRMLTLMYAVPDN